MAPKKLQRTKSPYTGGIKVRKKTGRNKNTAGQNLIICLLFIILLPFVFITLNESFFKIENIPEWGQIFNYFGLDGGGTVKTTVSKDSVSVHFIDVGQGDCELIQTPEYNILIDCGEKEYYRSVISYLKNNGVNKLDYVITTHPHSDHIGGMSYIINEFKTEKVIMPELQESMIPTTGSYSRLIVAVADSKCEVVYAKPGIIIDLGDDVKLEILAPVNHYDDLNDYSVVAKLTHGSNSFLFTGDIEKEAENDILASGAELSADVLKVAHHGSSTSSAKKFLSAVGGNYAVIEVGSPNTYNHPNEKVVDRLGVQRYNVLRTDLNGNIVFISNGNSLEVYVERQNTESNNIETESKIEDENKDAA